MTVATILARPGEPLMAHLDGVADLACEWMRQIPLDGELGAWREWLPELAWLAGLLHDLGKATAQFQQMLHGQRRRSKETAHAPMGALSIFHLARHWTTARGLPMPADLLLPIIASSAVLSHHSGLNSYAEWLDFIDADEGVLAPNEQRIWRAWIGSMDADILTAIGDRMTQRLGLPRDLLAATAIGDWRFAGLSKADYKRLKAWLNDAATSADLARTLALLQRVFLAVLLEADRYATIFGVGAPLPKRAELPDDLLSAAQANAATQRPSPLDAMRTAVQHSARLIAESAPLSTRQFRLSVPTGGGKTVASMAFALARRQLIYRETGRRPRIIYALPFLSIIDQTARIWRDAFHGASTLDVLAEHHHLATYPTDPSEPWHDRRADFLVESWFPEIVVTTTVQLFDAACGAACGDLRKLHHLAGSILILDEVQALPFRLRPFVDDLLRRLTDDFGCTVLLSSATQPQLLHDTAAIELNPSAAAHAAALDRVTLTADVRDEITVEQLGATAIEFREQHPAARMAVIVNTVGTAELVWRAMSKAGFRAEFLSTRVCPRDRQRRLANLRTSDADAPTTLISTQLIEAGIDLDFDIVVRDLAPLDSIIQAAGRCNRHANPERRGRVHVVATRLPSGKRLAAEQIYGSDLRLIRTREWLTARVPREGLAESAFPPMIDDFFRMLATQTDQSAGADALALESCWRHRDLAAQCRLIDEHGESRESVFVHTTDDSAAGEAWAEFLALADRLENMPARARLAHRSQLRALMRQLGQWLVTAPERLVADLAAPAYGIRYLGPELAATRYHPALGICETDDAGAPPAHVAF